MEFCSEKKNSNESSYYVRDKRGQTWPKDTIIQNDEKKNIFIQMCVDPAWVFLRKTKPVILNLNLNFGVQHQFQQYFSYIMATSFSGGGSRSTRKEPPILGKQLVNFITYHLRLWIECTFFVIYKAGREPKLIEPPGPLYQIRTASFVSLVLYHLNIASIWGKYRL